jgi:hypothetical protein
MTFSVIIAFSFLLGLAVALFMFSKIMERRMKNSRYGHSFDFSKMPNKKIRSKNSPGTTAAPGLSDEP